MLHGGCQSVAGTDRRQLNTYSVAQEIALGDEAYAEMQVGAKRDQRPGGITRWSFA